MFMDGSGNTEASTLHLGTMAAAILGVPAVAGVVPGHVTCVLKAYRWLPCPLNLSSPACPSEMTFLKLLWPCAYLRETSLGFSAARRRKARLRSLALRLLTRSPSSAWPHVP